jgi:hypothetical protein
MRSITSVIRSRAGAETRISAAPKRERSNRLPPYTYGSTMV